MVIIRVSLGNLNQILHRHFGEEIVHIRPMVDANVVYNHIWLATNLTILMNTHRRQGSVVLPSRLVVGLHLWSTRLPHRLGNALSVKLTLIRLEDGVTTKIHAGLRLFQDVLRWAQHLQIDRLQSVHIFVIVVQPMTLLEHIVCICEWSATLKEVLRILFHVVDAMPLNGCFRAVFHLACRHSICWIERSLLNFRFIITVSRHFLQVFVGFYQFFVL